MIENLFSEELITKIINEEVEEKLFAGRATTAVTHGEVINETVPAGKEGIVLGVAVSSDNTISLFVQYEQNKQYYENGLNTAGLSAVAAATGVGDEVPLMIKVKEQKRWALGFKASAGTPAVNWRIRVRYIKKK